MFFLKIIIFFLKKIFVFHNFLDFIKKFYTKKIFFYNYTNFIYSSPSRTTSINMKMKTKNTNICTEETLWTILKSCVKSHKFLEDMYQKMPILTLDHIRCADS